MTTCPDHETLAGLIERRLDPRSRAAVEAHVARCADCLDVVAAAVPKSPPRGRRAPIGTGRPRWARVAAAAGVALAVLGGLGYLAADALLDRLRVGVERLASTTLGAPVALRSAALTVTPNLRTIGVRLVGIDLGPTGTVGAIELLATTASLRGGRFEPTRVRLFQPRLAWTIPSAETAAAVVDGRALVGAIALAPAVEIIDGSLILGPATRVTEIAGHATRGERDVTLALTGTMADGRVAARGTIELGSTPRLDLTVTGDPPPGGTVLLAGHPGGIRLPLRIAGPLDELRLTGSGDTRPLTPASRGSEASAEPSSPR